MCPGQISDMHHDVMSSHHRKVALDTHSRVVAAATGFGGDKGGNYDKFIDRLNEATVTDAPEKRTVSMSELVAMGHQVAADQAAAGDEARIEREAQEAAMQAMFERHRHGTSRGIA